MKKIALSGIQTTGNLHLGNYLGSISNWLKMQDNYNCYFFLANLHAITMPYEPDDLRKSTFSAIATYLATGLDPEKSTIFLQSSIKEHSELAWILNCLTPIGWLKRMTQFKDKAGKNQDTSSAGLFTYPVLMAADILLYDADVVPVGGDQKQHLEITRNIAGVINRKFNREVLKMPEPLIEGVATRVMSLKDGQKKMSKSDVSDASRINMLDSPDQIMQKIKKSKTDSIEEFSYNPETRPELSNLINIYSSISEKRIDEIVKDYQSIGFAKFKIDLAEIIIEKLAPINMKYNKLIKDQTYLIETLETGADKARIVASRTCNRVKDLMGFSL
jgi:tryptophanyl-tRNA synthetase